MAESIFKLENVSFSYLNKFPALCAIDMDISRGQKIAILGPNGSGKSTLLQLLDGLIFPDKGNIYAFDRLMDESVFNDMDFSRRFRSKIGLVFQNPDIQLFCPTVREDILFGPLQLGIDRVKMSKQVDEIILKLEIGDLLDRSPNRLSLGEKRKVSIASILALDPEVLLLDEPTAGLDPLTTRHILDIITRANEDGKTIITATHDLHIVGEIADTAYVFNSEKKISRYGLVEELLADTQFLQSTNLMHIHKHRHKEGAHIHPHHHTDHHF